MPEAMIITPAAVPAAATAPAVTSTPAVPSPGVSPTPNTRHKPQPNATSSTTKTYATATPKPFVVKTTPPVEVPAAEASAVATETAVTDAKTADAKPAEVKVDLLPVDAEAATETPATETVEPAAEEAPTVDKAEFAKRMAKIARAEERLAAEKRKFSEERAKHTQALERVAQMDKARELVHKDAVGFLHRMFGVTPQQIVDQLVATSTGKPAPGGQAAQPNPNDDRIAALEKQLQDSLKETKERQAKTEERNYIASAVVPLVTDKTKYPFLNEEFGGQAADHVYRTMRANWDRGNKQGADPKVVADFIEKHFREKAARAAQLLGGGASTEQASTPKKVAAPQAAPKPAAAQQPPAVGLRRPRLTGKSYTVAVK